jgi:hypothetical protein
MAEHSLKALSTEVGLGHPDPCVIIVHRVLIYQLVLSLALFVLLDFMAIVQDLLHLLALDLALYHQSVLQAQHIYHLHFQLYHVLQEELVLYHLHLECDYGLLLTQQILRRST